MRNRSMIAIVFAMLTFVFLVGCEQAEFPTSVKGDNVVESTPSQDGTPNLEDKYTIIEFGILQPGQTQGYMCDPDQYYAITIQPWQVGSWNFTAYHTNPFAATEVMHMWYYWRDALNPNDPWHYFANGGAGYTIALADTEYLYSGSIGITYRVLFKCYGEGLPFLVSLD